MIYFMRHGERTEQRRRVKKNKKFRNVKKMSCKTREKYYKRLDQHNFYDRLTFRGRLATKKFALSLRDKKIDVIYCSPFKRCVDTANIVAKATNAMVITDYRLCERGTYNHIRHFDDNEFNYLWDNYLNYNFETTYIETAKHFVNRIKEFLFEIKQKHKNKNVLIVGHSCLTYAINTAINGVPSDGFVIHDKIDNNVLRELKY